MEFFLGNTSQQAIFRLMHSVLNKAKLTGQRTLMDHAVWLLQSDNLHLIQWAGRSGSEAEVSAYFTPNEWWELGGDRILFEQQNVYKNFIHAMDEYV
jgi:alpha-amylase